MSSDQATLRTEEQNALGVLIKGDKITLSIPKLRSSGINVSTHSWLSPPAESCVIPVAHSAVDTNRSYRVTWEPPHKHKSA